MIVPPQSDVREDPNVLRLYRLLSLLSILRPYLWTGSLLHVSDDLSIISYMVGERCLVVLLRNFCCLWPSTGPAMHPATLDVEVGEGYNAEFVLS